MRKANKQIRLINKNKYINEQVSKYKNIVIQNKETWKQQGNKE